MSRPRMMERVLRAVAAPVGVTVEEFVGRGHRSRLSMARQEAMWLTRRFTTLSYPQIAAHFGGRHYTTVIHGCREVDGLLRYDAAGTLKKRLNDLCSQLASEHVSGGAA